MNVKTFSFAALCALLVAGIAKAADSGYSQVSDGSPRLVSGAADSAEQLPRQDADELLEYSAGANELGARPTSAESILASRAVQGPLDAPEPAATPLPKLSRSSQTGNVSASSQLKKLSQVRTHSQPPSVGATPASYSARSNMPLAPRGAASGGTGSISSQNAAERFWQDSQRNSPTRSYSTSLAGVRQDGPMGSAAPESVAPGSAAAVPDGNLALSDGNLYCGDDCCGPEWSPCYNCCGFFGSVDYLLLRPTFSEDTSYVRRTIQLDSEENLTETDTVVPRDFGYSSGLRTSLGYRFCDCGGEIRFTYWNYDNCVNQVTPRAPADGSEIFIGQLETVTQIPGQRLLINNDLQFNLYDIEYAKCICYGGCSTCDPCKYCQPWSLKYYVGARIADIKRQDNGFLQNRDDSLARAWFINGDFIGAGPRVGLEGRRLFGEGRFSLFARSNLSLLLGQWDLGETRQTPAIDPSLTENYFDSHTRMIPEVEIELGGNYQITRNISIGAGYMFQAWWDLGAFEQIQGNVFLSPIDDSNIMGLDGLFARFEVCF